MPQFRHKHQASGSIRPILERILKKSPDPAAHRSSNATNPQKSCKNLLTTSKNPASPPKKTHHTPKASARIRQLK